MKTFWLCIAILCYGISSCSSESAEINQPQDEAIYFPPLNSETWEMVSISELGWNESQLQPLLEYLELKRSKGFVMLYNGKIIEGTERYMNGHSASTSWYWASAGKTLTSTVAGIAQDKGLININTKVSDYLGTGWTSAPLEKENLITGKHLLTMTSGLDDGLGDSVLAKDLHYTADAGTRWAYHNVYVKMQDVVSQASNQTWNAYFNSQLRDPIGMDGNWFSFENSNVYACTTRSMARFGLLIYAKGKWRNTQIVSENFYTLATATSQNINEAYGYLWWLNGKSTYHLPQTQQVFPGSLIPAAPLDMYAALGKNDQKLYVVPSKKLVIIRMGAAADALNFGLSEFDNVLWSKINALIN